MGVPISQMWTVASYVLGQKWRGVQRYPLVLMLEPLFRCNLACAGCGKIQYPAHILKRQLTPEECWKAADDCGAPMVSIPGGEPLMHPQIGEIVRGLVERKKYIYLCTNALLLKEKLDEFPVSKYLTFSVHMDGLEEEHDFAVCREGTYGRALEGIKAATARGHRVTTNTTLFQGADPERVRRFFDAMMALGVEGMTVAPGYQYAKAPDQGHFLARKQTSELFREILAEPKSHWRFNQSPLFLQFLMGMHDYDCTPWGNPTYNIFGWQKPCYLLQEGYAASFKELIEETEWEKYGHRNHEKCRDCMVHSGYEATAVDATFGTMSGFLSTVYATIMGYAVGVARAGLKTRKKGLLPLVEYVREEPAASAGGMPGAVVAASVPGCGGNAAAMATAAVTETVGASPATAGGERIAPLPAGASVGAATAVAAGCGSGSSSTCGSGHHHD